MPWRPEAAAIITLVHRGFRRSEKIQHEPRQGARRRACLGCPPRKQPHVQRLSPGPLTPACPTVSQPANPPGPVLWTGGPADSRHPPVHGALRRSLDPIPREGGRFRSRGRRPRHVAGRAEGRAAPAVAGEPPEPVVPLRRLFPARHAGAIAAEGRRAIHRGGASRRGPLHAAAPAARLSGTHFPPPGNQGYLCRVSPHFHRRRQDREDPRLDRRGRPGQRRGRPALSHVGGAGTAISSAMSAWWAARVPLLACPAVLETRLGKPTVAPAIPSVHPRKSPSSTSPARCSRPSTASSR